MLKLRFVWFLLTVVCLLYIFPSYSQVFEEITNVLMNREVELIRKMDFVKDEACKSLLNIAHLSVHYYIMGVFDATHYAT